MQTLIKNNKLNLTFRYYIEGLNEADAMFPPDSWNHFENQMDGTLGRTNNAQVCLIFFLPSPQLLSGFY